VFDRHGVGDLDVQPQFTVEAFQQGDKFGLTGDGALAEPINHARAARLDVQHLRREVLPSGRLVRVARENIGTQSRLRPRQHGREEEVD